MLTEPPSTRHRHNPSTLMHAPPHRREPSAHCDVRAHTADGCAGRAPGPSCNLGYPMSTRPPPSPPPPSMPPHTPPPVVPSPPSPTTHSPNPPSPPTPSPSPPSPTPPSAPPPSTTPSSLPRRPHPHLPHRTVLTVRRATPSRPEARSNPLVAIARSIYPCSRSMRCASCARGFPYGAELRGMS